MAVAFRASAVQGQNGSDLVISVPTGTLNGDIMVAVICITGASHTPSTPTGWTALDTETTGPSIKSFYRIASSEPANYTFTVGGNAAQGIIASYSGGHQTTPINAHGAWHRSTSTTTITADTITTTADGCMLVFLAGINSGSQTITGPTSYNQRATEGTISITAFLGDLIQNTQGATGSITATTSTAGSNTQGSLIAIAPPAAAAAAVPTLGLLGVGT